ncbi:nucleotidyltransferase substrate binding protein [Desulfurobacterium sp.]
MKEEEVLTKIRNFEKALERLDEAVTIARDELDKDGVIQRFEFTVELLWKALRAILSYHGIECYSPRNCIKEAFKANIISDDEIVLDMLKDRNLSSHIYDKTVSEQIFKRIKENYLPYFKSLELRKKFFS